MRADKEINNLNEIIVDKSKAIETLRDQIKLLREEVLRLRNGVRMLLVAEDWEKQPDPELVEYINSLLKGR